MTISTLTFQVDLSGDDGMTPLCYAARQGHIQVIRKLMARNARVRKKTQRGRSKKCLCEEKM